MQKELPVRKKIRLEGYDYSSAGAYFITICVKDRHELLWESVPVGTRSARPPLSDAGMVVENAIKKISVHYTMITVDKYVIMPNHIHMILIINDSEHGRALRIPTISTVINQMKGYISKQIGYSFWQSRFYEHIIRNEADFQAKWRYIDDNVIKWENDEYYGEIV